MTNNQYVLLPLQFHNDWFQSYNDISITLPAAVPIIELVEVAASIIFWIYFRNFLVCHAIANSGVQLIEGFPLELVVRETSSSLDCSTECGRPDC